MRLGYIYSALGQSFHSPFECPFFGISRPHASGHSIFLDTGNVPDALENPVLSRPLLQIDGRGSLLFRVPGVASYLLTDRNSITISPKDDTCLPRALDFLRGTPAALICLQQGFMPLSAICLAYHGRSFLLWSPPGTGKTSLAMALVQRGFSWMADGLCALDMRAGHPIIWPGFPVLKLWPDSLHALAIAPPPEGPGAGGRFAISADPWYEAEPQPLAAALLLTPAHGGISTRSQRLHGGAAFEAVAKMTSLPAVTHALGADPDILRSTARMAGAASVLDCRYPAGLDNLDAAADWLMDQMVSAQGGI